MEQDQIDMVQELCDMEGGLYPNEVDFIEELSKDEDKTLSEKQAAWLSRIHQRVTK